MSVNLLKNRAVNRFIKSRWYPAVPQALTAWIFVLITWQLLVGPSSADENFGSIYTWVLWWPILPLIFLALGRFWCSICPFGVLNDLVQKVVGRNRPVPPVLKKYGIWFIDAMFILITWADHIFGIFESPWATGAFMLVMITGVVVSGVLWQRRAWCRHLCFLGGLAGNYARNGIIEIRATPEKCAKCKSKAACYNGTDKVPACPVFEFPRKMETSANCNVCGNCIKSCPNDSIELRLRPPSYELYTNRQPRFEEAFLAIVVMGIVFVKNLTDTEIWDSTLKTVENLTGTGFEVSFTLIFLVAVNIPGAALTLASLLARKLNGDTWKRNLTLFGYALIPLDMAAVLAHTCTDILSHGKAIVFAPLGLIGFEIHGGSMALADVGTITIVQFILIGIGTLGSLYTTYRIAINWIDNRYKVRATIAPYASMILIFAAINFYIFALPKPVEGDTAAADSQAGELVFAGINWSFVGPALILLVLVSLGVAWIGTKRAKAKPVKVVHTTQEPVVSKQPAAIRD